jgi:hypothetical protein
MTVKIPTVASEKPYGAVGPVVSIVSVDDVDVHQGLLRDVSEQKQACDSEHRTSPEQGERTDRVGAAPGEGAAILSGERFGQDEETIKAVDEAE